MIGWLDEAQLIEYPMADVPGARNVIPRSASAPDPALARDQAMLLMIAEAQQRGLTWRQIGSAIIGSLDGRAAKRYAHQLARRVQAEMLRQEVATRSPSRGPYAQEIIADESARPYVGHDHGWFDECTDDCACTCGQPDEAHGRCRTCGRLVLAQEVASG